MQEENAKVTNNLSANAMILTASKILNTAIALLSTMLLARFRTLEEYGTYSQIQSVVSIATAVLLLGLPNSINFFLPRAETQKQKDVFLSLFYCLGTALSLLAGVILLLCSPLICTYYKNEQIKVYTYVLGLLPWINVITHSISNLLVATGNTKRLLVYNLLRSVSTLLIIFLVQIFEGNFQWYMAIYILVESFFALWVYMEVHSLVEKVYIKIDVGLLKAVLAFSIPMGLAAAVGTINVQLDHLMVGYFFDTETLAVFSNAAKELPFTLIATSFTAVLLPVMSRCFKKGEYVEAVDVWKKSVEFNAVILFFCATACIVFAPQIITILYSAQYLPGVPVFRIYSLVLLLRMTYFGIGLNALGQSKIIMRVSVLSLGVNLILDYILIRAFGPEGAALATILSIASGGLLQLWFTARKINIPLSKIFPWKELLRIALVNAMWAIPVCLVISIFNFSTDIYGIAAAILMGVGALLVYVLIYKKRVVGLYRSMGK